MKTLGPENPLSPHLQIYAPQLTSVMSILHRVTGIGFAAALCLTCVWIYALSQGESSYLNFCKCLEQPVMKLIFYAILTCVYYHLLNGMRYLVWSIGKGYDLGTVYKSGYLIAALVLILTILTVYLV